MDAEFNHSDDKTYVVPQNPNSAKTITTIVYALQAASLLLGLTLFVGVIISYIKREEVRGTWLESHFRWQIRTFWFSLLWLAIGSITFVAIIGYFILFADMLWLIYRVVKGWMNLSNGKTMYNS